MMLIDKACFERGCACYDDRVDSEPVEVIRKEWIGLTDEDKHYLNDVLNLQGRFPIIETIEAKLKEKNS
jgi:hypothetical protein